MSSGPSRTEGNPKFTRVEDVAFWLNSSRCFTEENRLELLLDIQDVAEACLEAACLRHGVSLLGLDESQAWAALAELVTKPGATASERSAHELLRWCVFARFEEWDESVRARILAAFAGLSADDLEHGRKRRQQQLQFSRSGAAARRIYTDAERLNWRRLYRERYARHTQRQAARLILQALGLPASAFESVRRELGKPENG